MKPVNNRTMYQLLQQHVPAAACDIGEWAERFGLASIEVRTHDGERYLWRNQSQTSSDESSSH